MLSCLKKCSFNNNNQSSVTVTSFCTVTNTLTENILGFPLLHGMPETREKQTYGGIMRKMIPLHSFRDIIITSDLQYALIEPPLWTEYPGLRPHTENTVTQRKQAVARKW